jgi:hypothetical protein
MHWQAMLLDIVASVHLTLNGKCTLRVSAAGNTKLRRSRESFDLIKSSFGPQHPEPPRNTRWSSFQSGRNNRPVALLPNHLKEPSVVLVGPRSDQRLLSLGNILFVGHDCRFRASRPRRQVHRAGWRTRSLLPSTSRDQAANSRRCLATSFRPSPSSPSRQLTHSGSSSPSSLGN